MSENKYLQTLRENGIDRLYHFTDRDNLASIISHGGLYSWMDCESQQIPIPKPGGSDVSRQLDSNKGLESYVRLSFTRNHPMMYVAMNDGRISNPVILEIDLSVVESPDVLYADMNAASNEVHVGGSLSDLKCIHFSTVKCKTHFDCSDEERRYYQAEVLVKSHIPLKYISNIRDFGLPIPTPNVSDVVAKETYTAQITRKTPTAFIFLVDHSGSMSSSVTFRGQTMSLAQAVSRIVNDQINELVLRCIKAEEIRHYYDIALIGYGSHAYSAWSGALEGRGFVSPDELKENPLHTQKVLVEKRTRRGMVEKEVEQVTWLEPCSDGGCTHVEAAMSQAKELLEEWMKRYGDKDCYPPTIINITDGEFNGASSDEILNLANDLKSMYTRDGNVLFFNIHISSNSGLSLSFPIDRSELKGDRYADLLYTMSSLLPLKYNHDICKLRSDTTDTRHVAMSVNADMSTLIQLMDIGTPTNIKQ